MRLRNINPLGAVDLVGIGLLQGDQEFEVTDAVGVALLMQIGNYTEVADVSSTLNVNPPTIPAAVPAADVNPES